MRIWWITRYIGHKMTWTNGFCFLIGWLWDIGIIIRNREMPQIWLKVTREALEKIDNNKLEIGALAPGDSERPSSGDSGVLCPWMAWLREETESERPKPLQPVRRVRRLVLSMWRGGCLMEFMNKSCVMLSCEQGSKEDQWPGILQPWYDGNN